MPAAYCTVCKKIMYYRNQRGTRLKDMQSRCCGAVVQNARWDQVRGCYIAEPRTKKGTHHEKGLYRMQGPANGCFESLDDFETWRRQE